ncbi:MAG: ATP-binding protein [Pseudomonadota bacterium]
MQATDITGQLGLIALGPIAAILGAAVAVQPELALALMPTVALFAAILLALRWRVMRMDPVRLQRAADARRAEIHREVVEDRIWALSDQEARYRELLDRQDDVILRRRADGMLTFVNRAFCDVFGVTWDDVVGTKFAPSELNADEQSTARTAAASGFQYGRAVQLATIDGPRWFDWSETTIPCTRPGADDVQCVGRDVTDQRAFADALSRARDAAEAANEAKSRFLASMSHEIRTPLNGIIGLTRALNGTKLSAEQTSFTAGVLKSADALLALIDDILDFSRIEAGRVELIDRPFAPRGLINDAISVVEDKADRKALAVLSRLDPDVPDHVLGDPLRVRQVLINLIDNAIKFTAEGHVRIRAHIADREGDDGHAQLVFEVTDTGPGFGQTDPEMLFREFEQSQNVRPARSGGLDGTGLGLAICRRLCEAMGGSIEACASTGSRNSGACFRVRLPLRLPAEEVFWSPGLARAPSTAPTRRMDAERRGTSPVVHARCHVLIVEDNAVNAMVAEAALRGLGHSSETVTCGDDALERLLTPPSNAADIDAVLLDLRLPDRDGYSVLKALQSAWSSSANQQGQKVIALTANAFPEDRERCLAAGFNAYLAKPFDPHELNTLLAA